MHKALKILILSSIFYNFAYGLLIPIFAVFVQQIGGGILEASRAWFIYTLLIGITIVTFGQIEDRISKRKMFLLGRILFTLGAVGYMFVTNIEELFFIQIILAIALAITNPAFPALFSRYLIKGKESTEWATWEGAVYIFLAIGAMTGGILAENYGFRMLFLMMSISMTFSTLTGAMLMRRNMWNAIVKKFYHIKS